MNYKYIKFAVIVFIISGSLSSCQLKSETQKEEAKAPNLIFVMADQWRAQDVGYMGNTDVQTSNLDQLAKENVSFSTAISNIPVCGPARASILTGQYPLTHGIFYNDKPLNSEAKTIAKVYKENGYNTGYIGKWHVNGHKEGEDSRACRLLPVPKDRRQGFDYWRTLECTHDYNNSMYYDENDEQHFWEGYDAKAQTDDAISYIKKNKDNKFMLFLSWGPPHEPYHTAPDEYKKIYEDYTINLRPNVPEDLKEKAQKDIAGYYSHIAALDDYVGELQNTIKEAGIDDNTIFVFTSDHGDMLYSHAERKKQKPWDESILVPFILKYPSKLDSPKTVSMPFSTPDIMPTLLGLSNLPIPEEVEGIDFSGYLTGKEELEVEAGLITCPVPFHQWRRERGGKEFRGVRTERYTYAKDLEGVWLLYDNQEDPYQLNNLANHPDYKELRKKLQANLDDLLSKTNDEFKKGEYYMDKWNYAWD